MHPVTYSFYNFKIYDKVYTDFGLNFQVFFGYEYTLICYEKIINDRHKII